MHIVFHRRKKSFLIIEMKLRHCITSQKNTEKTILFYIIVTVNRGTYLGIDQSMKPKFVSRATNTFIYFIFLLYLYIYPSDSQESDGGANT